MLLLIHILIPKIDPNSFQTKLFKHRANLLSPLFIWKNKQTKTWWAHDHIYIFHIFLLQKYFSYSASWQENTGKPPFFFLLLIHVLLSNTGIINLFSVPVKFPENRPWSAAIKIFCSCEKSSLNFMRFVFSDNLTAVLEVSPENVNWFSLTAPQFT